MGLLPFIAVGIGYNKGVMYIPSKFEEPRAEVMHELIRAYPLATIVTLGADGLNANHIPLYLAESTPFGTLQGHIPRANPMWKDAASDKEALAIFHGPDDYITPAWYATKQETGKVVPTWNYATVHAYGTLRVIDDAAWIRAQIEHLTAQQEGQFDTAWQVDDAPPDYINALLNTLVGIELTITRLQGKWKVSQNQPSTNRDGVIAGLHKKNGATAAPMVELVTAYGKSSSAVQ